MFLAHAFGARYDLPIPLWIFVVGAGAVVAGSFLVVLRRDPGLRPLIEYPIGSARSAPPALWGEIFLAITALLIFAGLTGSQEVPENILPTAFWLIVWIALPISCGIIGDWTRWVNPFATVARLADHPGLRRAVLAGPVRPWPARLAWWPAVALYFVVAAGELIYNGTATKPAVTALALVVYTLVCALGGLVFGAESFLARGEVFSVLLSTWGRVGWFRFGRPGPRGPLGGLDEPLDVSASRVTFVFLMLTSVTFDGLESTPLYHHAKSALDLHNGRPELILFDLAVFAAMVGLAWGLFGGVAAVVARIGVIAGGWRATLDHLLPSLLPIAFGYLIAHNLDYLAINGQLLIPLAGNPTGTHQWLPAPFNDSYEIDKNLLPSSALWYVQLLVVVAVHIGAISMVHARLRASGAARRLTERAEMAWTATMVAYTMVSLWLLASPIVKD